MHSHGRLINASEDILHVELLSTAERASAQLWPVCCRVHDHHCLWLPEYIAGVHADGTSLASQTWPVILLMILEVGRGS